MLEGRTVCLGDAVEDEEGVACGHGEISFRD
jgi:hypothetical protein